MPRLHINIYIYIFYFISLIYCDDDNKNPEYSVLIFSHSMAPSHLYVLFNVAEQYPSFPNNKIYDIRWPIVESVFNYPSRPNFQKVIFSSSMEKAEFFKQTLDEFKQPSNGNSFGGFLDKSKFILNIIKEFSGIIYTPCIKDELPSEIHEPVIALIDLGSFCAIAKARKHNAKMVYVSPVIEPVTLQILSGGPLPASYIMSVAQAVSQMNFLQRTINIFGQGIFKIFLYMIPLAKLFINDEKNLFRFPEPSLVFGSNHKFYDLPQPHTNAYIDIGNSKLQPPGELTQEIENFMQKYDQVVLLSFSTYYNNGTLPPNLYSIFVKTFKNFPKVGIIWRQKEELEKNSENVLLVSWINQRAFLAHSKAKGFITHCGLNSVIEAINAGVPMIATPISDDQFSNAERIRRRSLGIVLDLETLTEKSMTEALKNILDPKSIFVTNAKKIKEMFALEREQKISVNISHYLRKFQNTSSSDFQRFYIPLGNHLSWTQYFHLELFFIVFISFLIIF